MRVCPPLAMLPPNLEPTQCNDAKPIGLPHRVRWLLVLGAALLVLGLGVARGLEPDPRGYSTHEIMGFGPCTFRVLFNRPCPSCGMTTAWACAMRGRLLDAFRANFGGAVSSLGAMIAVPWLLTSAARGRWLFVRPRSEWAVVAMALLGFGILAQWLFRLLFGWHY